MTCRSCAVLTVVVLVILVSWWVCLTDATSWDTLHVTVLTAVVVAAAAQVHAVVGACLTCAATVATRSVTSHVIVQLWLRWWRSSQEAVVISRPGTPASDQSVNWLVASVDTWLLYMLHVLLMLSDVPGTNTVKTLNCTVNIECLLDHTWNLAANDRQKTTHQMKREIVNYTRGMLGGVPAAYDGQLAAASWSHYAHSRAAVLCLGLKPADSIVSSVTVEELVSAE